MNSINTASSLRIPSRQTLAELPARAVQFLRAVAGHRELQSALAERGYTPLQHNEGVQLLQEVCAYRNHAPNPSPERPQCEQTPLDWTTRTSESSPRLLEALALYQWYILWSAAARSQIKRRDWLILLGLAARRRRS